MYLIPVLTKFFIFASLSLATSILIGRLRCFTLGPVAFFMIGAYSSSVLFSVLGFSFFFSSLTSVLLTTVVGMSVGVAWKWIRGDHYAVVTLAVAEVTRQIVIAWPSLTGGNRSLVGIKPLIVFSSTLDSPTSLFLVSAGCFVFTLCVVAYLSVVPAHRYLMSIGSSPSVSSSLGINPLAYVIAMHGLAASLCAVSGIIYAHINQTLNPGWFTINESIVILLCCIVGGAGSAQGVVIGTAVVFLLPLLLPLESLSTHISGFFAELGLRRSPSEIVFPVRQALFGVLLIVCVLFLPEGLIRFAPQFRSKRDA